MIEEHFDDKPWRYGIKAWEFDVGAPGGDQTVMAEVRRVAQYIFVLGRPTHRGPGPRARRLAMKRRRHEVKTSWIWMVTGAGVRIDAALMHRAAQMIEKMPDPGTNAGVKTLSL